MNQENNFANIWNQSKTRDEQDATPDGKYMAVMNNAKLITGKASGKRMMVVEFEIKNPGSVADRNKVSKFYMFDEMGMGNLKTDLATMDRALGTITSEEDVVQQVYGLCPISLSVFVKSKLDKTGIMRTNLYVNGPGDSEFDSQTIPF
jgi:hypothetical protein